MIRLNNELGTSVYSNLQKGYMYSCLCITVYAFWSGSCARPQAPKGGEAYACHGLLLSGSAISILKESMSINFQACSAKKFSAVIVGEDDQLQCGHFSGS